MAILLLSELVALAVAVLVAQCSAAGANDERHESRTYFQIIGTNTSSGRLYSSLYEVGNGTFTFQSWTNIPYAKRSSSVSQRYGPPEEYNLPQDYLETTEAYHRPCFQYSFLEREYGSLVGDEEDCLTLSVYRFLGVYTEHDELRLRSEDEIQRLGNVIVLLRPGTFMYDYPFDGRTFAGSLCCDYLISVVVNYRLGPLGFLHDKSIVPNLGLLDQISALTWVQRNIEAFYGDPGKVTLIGVGAGAAAVHYHMITKKSKGLFSKAASFGGSALVPWAIARNGEQVTRKYIKIMNCTSEDADANARICLRDKDPKTAKRQLRTLYTWLNMPLSPLGPVVDYDLIEDEPLILMRMKAFQVVPWLVSFTDGAGSIPGARAMGADSGLYGLDNNFRELSPWILDYQNTMDEGLQYYFGQRTKKFYYSDRRTDYNSTGHEVELPSAKTKEVEIVRMLTDRLYTTGIVEAARLQGHPTSNEQVYLLRFSYVGQHTFNQVIFGHSLPFVLGNIEHFEKLNITSLGPAVADDFMVYIADQYNLTSFEDKNLQTYMSRILISFCVYGIPTVPITMIPADKRTSSMNEAPEMKHTNYIESGTKNYERSLIYRLQSRKVTYNHITGTDQYELKRSNNLGRGRYWRRAPFLFPKIGFKLNTSTPVFYEQFTSNSDDDN